MSSQLNFFCTLNDVVRCFLRVEESEELRYYPKSSQDPLPATADSAADLLTNTIIAHNGRLLVARRSIVVHARRIEPTTGSPWYAFDQLENPDSVLFYLGTERPGLLTPGSLGTIGKTEESVESFKSISKAFKKECTRVKSYWVGRDALALLRSGCRLTVNETASPTYDLKEK